MKKVNYQPFYLWKLLQHALTSSEMVHHSSNVRFKEGSGFGKERMSKRSIYNVDLWGSYVYFHLNVRLEGENEDIKIADLLNYNVSFYLIAKVQALKYLRDNKKREAYLMSKNQDAYNYPYITDKVQKVLDDVRAFRNNPNMIEIMNRLPYAIEYLKFNNI